MAIRIVAPIEPYSPQSLALTVESVLIGSSGASHLEHELRRYCQGEIEGRSFLIAGHRGAGKTTMINQCVLKTRKASVTEGFTYLPLLIRLHGPSLIRKKASEVKAKPDNKLSVPATPDSAQGTTQDGAPAKDAGALAIADSARRLRELDDEEDDDRQQVKLALEQITLALHRALATELTQAYRLRIDGLTGRIPVSKQNVLYERAAQLALELDQYTTPDRLREFWAAGRFLSEGVLPISKPARDQGFRELVALSATCQAYGRVSGTFAKAEVKQSVSSAQTTALSTAKEGLDLVSPFVSILVGGATGTAAFTTQTAGGDAMTSAAAGLLAALGSAAVFKYSSQRSRTRTYSADLTFVPDTRLDTLDRALPTLISRVVEVGLRPVFVIDELDKIDGLYQELESIVRHVKTMVAERAFFCFLTDRSYFEQVVRMDVGDPYPKHFTYFTDRLFVTFQPKDLHTYLGDVLKTDAGEERPADAEVAGGTLAEPVAQRNNDDDLDLDVLRFVLLRRSEMHAVRLRRQIGSWSRKAIMNGAGSRHDTLLFEPGVVRQHMRYRFDLLIQFAIELIMHRPVIADRLLDDPSFSRLVYDALYYPVRVMNVTPQAVAKDPGAPESRPMLDLRDRNDFERYLIDRMSSDPPQPTEPKAPAMTLESGDSLLLFEQVRDLAGLLASPYTLLDELAAARNHHFTRDTEAVLSALPLNPANGPLLQARLDTPHVYEWRYDPDWNPRE